MLLTTAEFVKFVRIDKLYKMYYIYPMTSTISASEARNNFSEIINRVQYKGESIIIEKQGKPVAKIVAMAETTEEKKQFNPPVFAMGGAKSHYSRKEIYE